MNNTHKFVLLWNQLMATSMNDKERTSVENQLFALRGKVHPEILLSNKQVRVHGDKSAMIAFLK